MQKQQCKMQQTRAYNLQSIDVHSTTQHKPQNPTQLI